jgi:hypothetical protein
MPHILSNFLKKKKLTIAKYWNPYHWMNSAAFHHSVCVIFSGTSLYFGNFSVHSLTLTGSTPPGPQLVQELPNVSSGAPEFTPVFREVRVARSLVFCVVFFRSLFVLLFFFYIGYFTGYVQVYMHTSQNVTEEVQIRIEPVNVNDWTAKFPKYKDVPENITQTEWWKAAHINLFIQFVSLMRWFTIFNHLFIE